MELAFVLKIFFAVWRHAAEPENFLITDRKPTANYAAFRCVTKAENDSNRHHRG